MKFKPGDAVVCLGWVDGEVFKGVISSEENYINNRKYYSVWMDHVNKDWLWDEDRLELESIYYSPLFKALS